MAKIINMWRLMKGYPVLGSGGRFTHAMEYMYDQESVLLGRKGTIDKPIYVNEPFWTVDHDVLHRD